MQRKVSSMEDTVLDSKNAAIRDAASKLRRRFGVAFDFVDYWPGEPGTIGIARPGEDDPCVCILTAGKAAGRFDVQLGEKQYQDCVIQGLEWAVQEGLQGGSS